MNRENTKKSGVRLSHIVVIIGLLIVAGVIGTVGVIYLNDYFGKSPENPNPPITHERPNPPIALRVVSKSELEKRIKLAQANERKIIQALGATVPEFDKSTMRLTSVNGRHNGAFEFSPDGKTVAIGKEGAGIEIHDFLSGKVIQTLDCQERKIKAIAFSPVDRTLATISSAARNHVCIWDLETGKRKNEIELSFAYELHFSPDGSRLFVDYSLRNSRDLSEIRKFGTGLFDRAIFSPTGRFFAVTKNGDTAEIFDSQTFESLGKFAGVVESSILRAAFSPDEGKLAVFGSEVMIYDIKSGSKIQLPVEPDFAGNVRQTPMHKGGFSTDGKFLVTTNDNSFKAMKFWDWKTGAEKKPRYPYSRDPFRISPGGLLIATDNLWERVEIWAMPHALDQN